MNININSIAIEKGETQKGFRLSLTSNEHVDKTFYYFGESEIDYLLSCIDGTAKFYPYFDDGLYLLKITPNGIHCVHSTTNEQYWFTFPANELKCWIHAVQDCIINEVEYNKDISDSIPVWHKIYSPNVKIQWQDDNIESRFLDDIDNPLVENREYASNWLQDRLNHCASYSNGNLITLHISYDRNPVDNIPTSYYWEIRSTDNQRIYNGGFIAHKYSNDDGTVYYKYASHT